jgi:hypothetical protein
MKEKEMRGADQNPMITEKKMKEKEKKDPVGPPRETTEEKQAGKIHQKIMVRFFLFNY